MDDLASTTPHIFLIGLQQADAPPGDFSVIAEAFRRLPTEVAFARPYSRLLGYDVEGAGGRLRFIGAEAPASAPIPAGMSAWELEAERLTVWRGDAGKRAAVQRMSIEWTWSALTGASADTWIGEFRSREFARTPTETPFDAHAALFAAAPFGEQNPGAVDDVRLVDYDPAWPERFAEISQRLAQKLGDVALRIEHYGSTAIPGIPAKPVIDVLVEVPSFDAAKERAAPLLCDETCEYWWYGNHMAFIQRAAPMGPRVCHMHLAPRDHRIWEGLAFRDYLRVHRDVADEYAALKRRLAVDHRKDRERYTDEKTAFVLEITAKALRR